MNTCLSCGRYVGSDALPDGGRFCPHCGALVSDGSAGLIDQVLNDKYRVLSELGEGSMGRVYLGEHIKLQKKVAIKVLRPDLLVSEDSIKRFQREGVTAGQFNHPNAIQIFDLDRSMGLFYLAMEYVDGKSLAEVIRERGQITPSLAIDLTRQILAALAAAHHQGIVHRDLKPDNVMVSGDVDSEPLVKVLDFGLSKLVHTPDDASLRTQTGMILGTPLYMAPEQCAGEEADQRSDIFSVGLVLMEMLSGGLPLRGQNVSRILIERATHNVPSVHDLRPDLALPTALDPVLRRSLQMAAKDRYPNANEMIKDLDAVDLNDLSKADPAAAARARAAMGSDSSSTIVQQASEFTPTVRIPPGGKARRPWLSKRTIGVVAAVAAIVVAVIYAPLWRNAVADDPGSRGPFRVRERTEGSWTPQDREYLTTLDEARILIGAGDFVKASACLLRAHGSTSLDAEAFLVRGQLYARKNDLDTARLDFQEALHRDTTFADAAVALGFAEFDLGFFGRARQRFEQALQIREGNDAAQVGMAAITATEGRDAEALALLDTAISRGQKSVRALLLRGQLHLRLNNPAEAVKSLMDAKRTDGTASGVLETLGKAYLAAGRQEEAERELRAALAQNPDSEPAATDLATLLLEIDRTAEALTVVESALDLIPRSIPLSVVHGLVLAARNDNAGAIAALKKARSRGSSDPRVLQLLTILQLEEGGQPDLEALASTSGAAPSLSADLAFRGVARFRAGEFASARDDFEKVLENDEEDEFAHKALGVLYMDYLPDPNGLAVDHLKRVIELRNDEDCEDIRDWIFWIRTRG